MRRVTPDTIAVVDLAVCDRCGLCLPLCPPEAIHLELNVLTVDRAACTGCENASVPAPSGRLPWWPMPDVDVLVVGAGPPGAPPPPPPTQAAPPVDRLLPRRDTARG